MIKIAAHSRNLSNFVTKQHKYPWDLGAPSNTTLRILSVKGGGGTPQIRNPLFAENFIRKEWEGVTPKSVTYFLDQIQVFFEQYTQFLAFKKKYREMSVKLGRGGTPKI